MNDDFYNNKKWRKHAAAILSRSNYIDQVEKRYGRMISAEVVHHILPLELYPEYAWNDFNLIAVSKKTHDLLHNMDGTLTKKGLELARTTARKNKIDISALEFQAQSNHATRGNRYDTKCSIK